MLSRWLHRGGLGQMLAPDPKIKEKEETAERDEFTGGFWSLVAPDPNFKSPDPKSNQLQQDISVNANFDANNQKNDNAQHPYNTPSKANTDSRPSFLSPSSKTMTVSPAVERLVLSAAKDLTTSMLSPPNVWEDNKNFFSYCASSTKLSDKKLKKVKKMLRKDPSLVNARASNMGNLVQNGYTPLHAACSVGNYDVALILIDFTISEENQAGAVTDVDAGTEGLDLDTENDENKENPKLIHPVDLDARDVQGRTALHIASVHGHIPIVQLLKEKMMERSGVEPIGGNAPTDLTGRTPLGWAATSRETKARKNIDKLREELFSPGDKSVYGERTPAFMRSGCHGRYSQSHGIEANASAKPMDLSFGFADMPGHRIEMEDAICKAYPLIPPTKSDIIGFFGVFDGHGDGGVSSEFVAENIVPYFTSSEEYKTYNGDVNALGTSLTKACNTADEKLKIHLSKGNSVRHGGSTGVMAVVTSDSILIGNVGDSRCVLVQKCAESPSESENDSEVLEATKKMEALSMETDGDNTNTNAVSLCLGTLAKPLSTDHKPNIPEEAERIKKAGMEVIEETFTIEGETITLSKIHKSHSDRIAVSRAFGDFDYKANTEISNDEQAIICTPEITVHPRDHSLDMYLILACDGVYDVMSNDEVGDFVVNQVNLLGNGKRGAIETILPDVGDELLKKCLDLGSSDNMSVLIVALPNCVARNNGNVDEDYAKKLNFADV